jgi:hypothetical protein
MIFIPSSATQRFRKTAKTKTRMADVASEVERAFGQLRVEPGAPMAKMSECSERFWPSSRHSRRPRILVATADLGLWMWARQLHESTSLNPLLELTAPLNPPSLTPRAP